MGGTDKEFVYFFSKNFQQNFWNKFVLEVNPNSSLDSSLAVRYGLKWFETLLNSADLDFKMKLP